MKMLCFKFEQNCTINEQFDFFEAKVGGGLNLNYHWYTHEIVDFQFKFQQNHTISEDFAPYIKNLNF